MDDSDSGEGISEANVRKRPSKEVGGGQRFKASSQSQHAPSESKIKPLNPPDLRASPGKITINDQRDGH